MKKVKRLSLSSLAKEAIIMSQQEQADVYAGSGIDGFCFFEALEILSSNFGCNYSESYFINNFAASYGYSTVIGPNGTIPGINPGQANAYAMNQFSASAINFSQMQDTLNSHGEILAALNEGNGVVHAIVITGYNSLTGTYSYNDANGGGTTTLTQLNSAMLLGINSEIPQH